MQQGVCVVFEDHLSINRAIEVLTVTALAVVTTEDSRLETLAVFLKTT